MLPYIHILEVIVVQYFKKPNGIILEATHNLDLESLKDRFLECDVDGKELKKEKPVKKTVKKKASK